MKKAVIIVVFALISLMLFCSCARNDPAENIPAKPETVAIAYADIFEANAYSAITANHSSILLKDSELTNGEFVECEYYWTKSGFAYTTYPYADAEGNSARDAIYISDEGPYMYFSPMTAENAAFDLLQFYVESGLLTIEDMAVFGLVTPEYNQTITECKKTDNGYEITGENSDMSYLPLFYSAFFSEGECADGDKIMFQMVLNEKYEVLEYENYYVYADGRASVKASYGEFVYDSDDCPDFAKNMSSALEQGAKDTSVRVYTENGVLERTVYSDIFLLYTDYDVYSDAEYTDLLADDAGYYMFDTSNDISVYLKAPMTEE